MLAKKIQKKFTTAQSHLMGFQPKPGLPCTNFPLESMYGIVDSKGSLASDSNSKAGSEFSPATWPRLFARTMQMNRANN